MSENKNESSLIEEQKIEIKDKREIPLELQIGNFFTERGIVNLEEVRNLIEPNFYAVIPVSILENRILRPNSKLLYAEIIALSKKSGKCYATNEFLAQRLGISENTVPELLKNLEKNNIVKINIERNTKGTFRTILVNYGGRGGAVTRGGGVLIEGDIIDIKQRNNNVSKDTLEKPSVLPISVFNLKEEINKLKTDKRRHIQLIGEFLEEKKINLETKEQFKEAIQRHVSPARKLANFSDKQIAYASKKAEQNYSDIWTLETLIKILTSQKI